MQELRIPVCKEMLLITWPSRANPSTGEANLRERQESGNIYNKQTTTAIRTSLDKKFHEQSNLLCECDFNLDFLAILCKIPLWNDKILYGLKKLENVNQSGDFI